MQEESNVSLISLWSEDTNGHFVSKEPISEVANFKRVINKAINLEQALFVGQ